MTIKMMAIPRRPSMKRSRLGFPGGPESVGFMERDSAGLADGAEKLAQTVLAGRDGRVARGIAGPVARRQALDHGVVVGLMEEHDGLPTAAQRSIARWVDHAVERG